MKSVTRPHVVRCRRQFSSIFDPEYAFEMASSSVRFGRGVTKEIGYDIQSLGIKDKVCVITDANMVNLPPVKKVLDSLSKLNIQYEVFDRVQVEPTGMQRY